MTLTPASFRVLETGDRRYGSIVVFMLAESSSHHVALLAAVEQQ
ncbi:hypothetical protein [Leptolyngbya iicbica]|nr:hypothetical protein [Leptolyngbya sp. LK]